VIVLAALVVMAFAAGKGSSPTSESVSAPSSVAVPSVVVTVTPSAAATVAPAPLSTPTQPRTPTAKPSFSGEQLFSLNPAGQEFARRADDILCSGRSLPEIGRSDSAYWPVLIAQRQLNLIYPSQGSDPNNITVNGVFGPITQRQTARFQFDSYATVTGVVGPETWQRFRRIRCEGAPVPAPRTAEGVNSSYVSDRLCGASAGSLPVVSSSAGSPEAVALLQEALLGRGYDPGPIDGQFGSRTRSALIAYQAARGLTVDGLAGPQTWSSLQASYCDFG